MSMVLQIDPRDDSPFSSARWVPAAEAADKSADKGKTAPDRPFFSEEGLTFNDVLDMVNPLQHLPIIGPLYRELTGDTLSPGARLIGGTIFGGPLGLAGAAFELGVEQEFGRDPGSMLLAAVKGEEIAPALVKPTTLVGEAVGVPTDVVAALPVATDAVPVAAITSETLPAPAIQSASASTTPAAAGGIAFNAGRAPVSLTQGLVPGGVVPTTASPAQPAPAKVATSLPLSSGPVSLTGAPAVPAVGGGAVSSQSAPLGGGSPVAASPASTAASAAGGISLPPGSTGLLTTSGLPSAGSITPAMTMLATQQQSGNNPAAAQQAMQNDPTGKFSGNAGVAAYQASREAAPMQQAAALQAGAQSAQTAQPQAADAGQRWFDLPASRAPVNNGARVPPVINRPDVKPSAAVQAQLGGEPEAAQVLNPLVQPASAGASGSQAGVSDAMKAALDKYDALINSRKSGGGVSRSY